MTDKKLTDNEIVKALECSVKDKCPECPYFHSYPCDKCRKMRKDALDLINRLQEKDKTRHKVFENKCEELEIAKAENEELKAINESLKTDRPFLVATAKAEAYKEFAEKLENRILSMPTTATLEEKEIICACIGINNNVLKELVGEDNESKN